MNALNFLLGVFAALALASVVVPGDAAHTMLRRWTIASGLACLAVGVLEVVA